MKEILESCLKSIERQQLSLVDLIVEVCPAKLAYLHQDRAPDFPVDTAPADRLQRLVDSEHRKTLRKYLIESVPGFVPFENRIEINEVFSEEILGAVAGYPIYAFYTSEPVAAPAHTAVLISDVLAERFCVSKTALICVNRDTLEWTFWTVESQSSHQAAKEVLSDAQYVEGIVLGKAPAEGISTECLTCPYQTTCEVKDKFNAAPHTLGIATLRTYKMEKMIEDYLLSLNKEDDGRNTGFLSPSEICTTKCNRKLWYKRNRTPRESEIEPILRRIFDMGHSVHEVLQGMLHEASADFKSEVRAIFPRTTIKGRCDGVLGKIGLEIKSISKKGFDSVRGPKTPHHRQGTIYGASLDLEKMLYVYFNKSTGEVKSVYKKVDEKYAEEVRQRATLIEDMFDRNEIPEREAGWGCKMCSYIKTCKPEL